MTDDEFEIAVEPYHIRGTVKWYLFTSRLVIVRKGAKPTDLSRLLEPFKDQEVIVTMEIHTRVKPGPKTDPEKSR